MDILTTLRHSKSSCSRMPLSSQLALLSDSSIQLDFESFRPCERALLVLSAER